MKQQAAISGRVSGDADDFLDSQEIKHVTEEEKIRAIELYVNDG